MQVPQPEAFNQPRLHVATTVHNRGDQYEAVEQPVNDSPRRFSQLTVIFLTYRQQFEDLTPALREVTQRFGSTEQVFQYSHRIAWVLDGDVVHDSVEIFQRTRVPLDAPLSHLS